MSFWLAIASRGMLITSKLPGYRSGLRDIFNGERGPGRLIVHGTGGKASNDEMLNGTPSQPVSPADVVTSSHRAQTPIDRETGQVQFPDGQKGLISGAFVQIPLSKASKPSPLDRSTGMDAG